MWNVKCDHPITQLPLEKSCTTYIDVTVHFSPKQLIETLPFLREWSMALPSSIISLTSTYRILWSPSFQNYSIYSPKISFFLSFLRSTKQLNLTLLSFEFPTYPQVLGNRKAFFLPKALTKKRCNLKNERRRRRERGMFSPYLFFVTCFFFSYVCGTIQIT